MSSLTSFKTEVHDFALQNQERKDSWAYMFDKLDLCITHKSGIGFAFQLLSQISIHILEVYVKSHVIQNGGSQFRTPKPRN